MKRIINFTTYVGAICFLMAFLIVTELGVQIVLSKIPVYFPTHKHDDLTAWILWIGWGFMLFSVQQLTYYVWKNYLKLETK
jgi:hypothetical protein